jgi:hypothetical protein
LIILIIFVKNTNYGAPHYTAFLNLVSLHFCSVQILSSPPSHNVRDQVPHTHTGPQENHNYLYYNCYVFRKTKDSGLNGTSVNFLLNQILICHCNSYIKNYPLKFGNS